VHAPHGDDRRLRCDAMAFIEPAPFEHRAAGKPRPVSGTATAGHAGRAALRRRPCVRWWHPHKAEHSSPEAYPPRGPIWIASTTADPLGQDGLSTAGERNAPDEQRAPIRTASRAAPAKAIATRFGGAPLAVERPGLGRAPPRQPAIQRQAPSTGADTGRTDQQATQRRRSPPERGHCRPPRRSPDLGQLPQPDPPDRRRTRLIQRQPEVHHLRRKHRPSFALRRAATTLHVRARAHPSEHCPLWRRATCVALRLEREPTEISPKRTFVTWEKSCPVVLWERSWISFEQSWAL
jgi:hypothetical protein